jgi:hypothetical protein
VAERVPIGTVIDRGHDYLRPPDTDPTFTKYRAFLDAAQTRGATYEPFRVGRADQIVLRRDRSAFANVEVRAGTPAGTNTAADPRGGWQCALGSCSEWPFS